MSEMANDVRSLLYSSVMRVGCILLVVALIVGLAVFGFITLHYELSLAMTDLLMLLMVAFAVSVAMTGVYAYLHYHFLEGSLAPLRKQAAFGEEAASVVHDLRGPLTGLQVALRHLPEEELQSEKSEQVVQLLKMSATRLEGIAEEFMEAKRASQEAATTQVNEIIAGLYAEYSARPDLSEIRFVDAVDVPPLYVNCPGKSLQRMLANICKNAIEAMGGSGTLSFGLDRAGDTAVISIQDDGPGMPRDLARQIMTGTSTSQGKANGNGIGLRSVHQKITSLGGEIRVESTEGEGTTIVLRLPLAEPATNVIPLVQQNAS